mgnify:CR=1 FL=1
METLTGTYYNGKLKLDKPFLPKKPAKVIVIIVEEDEESSLSLSDFSFSETQELLKDCNTSFSDEVIEERRKAV